MPKNNNLMNWSLTLLRVYLGVMFTLHGYIKLFVPGALPSTATFFSLIGIPMANVAAVIVALAEFTGGILLVLGLFTKITSFVLLIEMLIAFAKVHLNMGFFVSQKAYGYEYILLIIVVLIVLLVNGPGNLSAGKMLFKKKYLQ